MPQYTLHRDYVLATTKGIRIAFEKDKPVYVPPHAVPDVVAIGALAVDGAPVDLTGEPEPKPQPEADATKRQADILEAIKMICERNQRLDFAASGAPKEAAIAKLTGYEVSRKERDLAWQAYHDLKAAA
jgi:hypothetical protein